MINLSDKSDSCSRAYVDEWPSAAPSLYICQSWSRASGVKRDKLGPKRRPFTFHGPPSGAPPLYPIQVLGGTLKCLLAYSIFTPPIEIPEPTSVLAFFFLPSIHPKRLFVRRMAHFSQGLKLAAFFSFLLSTTELFCRSLYVYSMTGC